MKKILILIFLVTIVSCKSKAPKTSANKTIAVKTESTIAKERFEKVSAKEVKTIKQNRAFDLGKRLLETCNTSVFKVFTSEEATEKVRNNATVEKISKTCQKILFRNGKFINLELLDITHDNETDDYIFKFDIIFEKKYFKRELYVTVNSIDKVSEIKSKEVYRKPN